MTYKDYYINGITKLVLESDGENLTGLWFDGSHDNSKHSDAATKKNLPIFAQTKKWLDIYFSGKNPDFVPQLKINNLTSFRKEVYEIMRHIPYGKNMTYGEIAEILAKKKGIQPRNQKDVCSGCWWSSWSKSNLHYSSLPPRCWKNKPGWLWWGNREQKNVA